MFFLRKKTNAVPDEQAMQEVLLLLDEWKAPEVSPWFDARMAARFREEQARSPESLFGRLRDSWLFHHHAIAKPLMAGAMAVLLVAGGGSYWQATHMSTKANSAGVSATLQDLQVIDNDAQAIQQMDQLLDDSDGDASPQS